MSGKNIGLFRSRRDLLKTSAAVGATTWAFGASALSGFEHEERTNDSIWVSGDEQTRDSAFAEQEHYYNMEENNYYRLDSAIECVGGNLSDDPEYDWVAHFRITTVGAARRYNVDNEDPSDGESIDVLSKHKLSGSRDGPGDVRVDLFGDKNGVAGWPTPSDEEIIDEEDALEELAKIAISAINPIVAFPIAAIEFYQAISSEEDSTADFSTNHFTWDYGDTEISDQKSDIAHAVNFRVALDLGESTDVYWNTRMFDGSLNNLVNWKVNLEAPPEPTPTPTDSPTPSPTPSPTSTPSPSPTPTESDTPEECPSTDLCYNRLKAIERMSKKQRKQWGFRRVPVKQLKEAGVPIGNPPTYSDGTTWYATSPPVTFGVSKKTVGKPD